MKKLILKNVKQFDQDHWAKDSEKNLTSKATPKSWLHPAALSDIMKQTKEPYC